MVELLLLLLGLVILLVCVVIAEDENEKDKNNKLNQIYQLQNINRKLSSDLVEIRKYYARK